MVTGINFSVGKARTAFAFVFVTCSAKAARVLVHQRNSWFPLLDGKFLIDSTYGNESLTLGTTGSITWKSSTTWSIGRIFPMTISAGMNWSHGEKLFNGGR